MEQKSERKKTEKNKAMKAVNAYRDTGHSTDPLGMYTGVTSDTPSASTLMRVDQATDNGKQFYRLHSPEKPYLEAHKREPRSGEMPVQDADDL